MESSKRLNILKVINIVVTAISVILTIVFFFMHLSNNLYEIATENTTWYFYITIVIASLNILLSLILSRFNKRNVTVIIIMLLIIFPLLGSIEIIRSTDQAKQFVSVISSNDLSTNLKNEYGFDIPKDKDVLVCDYSRIQVAKNKKNAVDNVSGEVVYFINLDEKESEIIESKLNTWQKEIDVSYSFLFVVDYDYIKVLTKNDENISINDNYKYYLAAIYSIKDHRLCFIETKLDLSYNR